MGTVKFRLTYVNSDATLGKALCSQNVIKIGRDLANQIRLKNPVALKLHCKVKADKNGSCKCINYSAEHPAQVNHVAVEKHQSLENNDVVTVLGSSFLFELVGGGRKSDASAKTNVEEENARKTAALKRVSGQKRKTTFVSSLMAKRRRSYKKRITVHEFAAMQAVNEESPASDSPTYHDTPKTPNKSIGGPSIVNSPNKENLSSMSLCLNYSGTLTTSYTPNARVRKLVETPNSCYGTPKSVLSERNVSLHFMRIEENSTPRAVTKNLKHGPKSMHLIDLTTPQVNKTPKNSPQVSTPKTVKKRNLIDLTTPENYSTPVGQKTGSLLKSALKNTTGRTPSTALLHKKPKFTLDGAQSSSKVTGSPKIPVKRHSCISNATSTPISSRTLLLRTPQKQVSTPISEVKAKLIVESITDTEQVTLKTPTRNVPVVLKTPVEIVQQKERRIIKLSRPKTPVVSDLEGIEPLETPQQPMGSNDMLPRSDSEIVESVEECTSVEAEPTKIDEIDESIISPDQVFDELAGNPIIKHTYTRKSNSLSPAKVAQDPVVKPDVSEWVNSVQATTSAPKTPNTVQILSSRYSNVTPHEPIAEPEASVATPQLDSSVITFKKIYTTLVTPRTPEATKQAVNRLSFTPLNRMSISSVGQVDEIEPANTSTTPLLQKSMRSTRKRIGSAFMFLNTSNLNDSCLNNSMCSENGEGEGENNQGDENLNGTFTLPVEDTTEVLAPASQQYNEEVLTENVSTEIVETPRKVTPLRPSSTPCNAPSSSIMEGRDSCESIVAILETTSTDVDKTDAEDVATVAPEESTCETPNPVRTRRRSATPSKVQASPILTRRNSAKTIVSETPMKIADLEQITEVERTEPAEAEVASEDSVAASQQQGAGEIAEQGESVAEICETPQPVRQSVRRRSATPTKVQPSPITKRRNSTKAVDTVSLVQSSDLEPIAEIDQPVAESTVKIDVESKHENLSSHEEPISDNQQTSSEVVQVEETDDAEQDPTTEVAQPTTEAATIEVEPENTAMRADANPIVVGDNESSPEMTENENIGLAEILPPALQQHNEEVVTENVTTEISETPKKVPLVTPFHPNALRKSLIPSKSPNPKVENDLRENLTDEFLHIPPVKPETVSGNLDNIDTNSAHQYDDATTVAAEMTENENIGSAEILAPASQQHNEEVGTENVTTEVSETPKKVPLVTPFHPNALRKSLTSSTSSNPTLENDSREKLKDEFLHILPVAISETVIGDLDNIDANSARQHDDATTVAAEESTCEIPNPIRTRRRSATPSKVQPSPISTRRNSAKTVVSATPKKIADLEQISEVDLKSPETVEIALEEAVSASQQQSTDDTVAEICETPKPVRQSVRRRSATPTKVQPSPIKKRRNSTKDMDIVSLVKSSDLEPITEVETVAETVNIEIESNHDKISVDSASAEQTFTVAVQVEETSDADLEPMTAVDQPAAETVKIEKESKHNEPSVDLASVEPTSAEIVQLKDTNDADLEPMTEVDQDNTIESAKIEVEPENAALTTEEVAHQIQIQIVEPSPEMSENETIEVLAPASQQIDEAICAEKDTSEICETPRKVPLVTPFHPNALRKSLRQSNAHDTIGDTTCSDLDTINAAPQEAEESTCKTPKPVRTRRQSATPSKAQPSPISTRRNSAKTIVSATPMKMADLEQITEVELTEPAKAEIAVITSKHHDAEEVTGAGEIIAETCETPKPLRQSVRRRSATPTKVQPSPIKKRRNSTKVMETASLAKNSDLVPITEVDQPVAETVNIEVESTQEDPASTQQTSAEAIDAGQESVSVENQPPPESAKTVEVDELSSKMCSTPVRQSARRLNATPNKVQPSPITKRRNSTKTMDLVTSTVKSCDLEAITEVEQSTLVVANVEIEPEQENRSTTTELENEEFARGAQQKATEIVVVETPSSKIPGTPVRQSARRQNATPSKVQPSPITKRRGSTNAIASTSIMTLGDLESITEVVTPTQNASEIVIEAENNDESLSTLQQSPSKNVEAPKETVAGTSESGIEAEKVDEPIEEQATTKIDVVDTIAEIALDNTTTLLNVETPKAIRQGVRRRSATPSKAVASPITARRNSRKTIAAISSVKSGDLDIITEVDQPTPTTNQEEANAPEIDVQTPIEEPVVIADGTPNVVLETPQTPSELQPVDASKIDETEVENPDITNMTMEFVNMEHKTLILVDETTNHLDESCAPENIESVYLGAEQSISKIDTTSNPLGETSFIDSSIGEEQITTEERTRNENNSTRIEQSDTSNVLDDTSDLENVNISGIAVADVEAPIEEPDTIDIFAETQNASERAVDAVNDSIVEATQQIGMESTAAVHKEPNETIAEADIGLVLVAPAGEITLPVDIEQENQVSVQVEGVDVIQISEQSKLEAETIESEESTKDQIEEEKAVSEVNATEEVQLEFTAENTEKTYDENSADCNNEANIEETATIVDKPVETSQENEVPLQCPTVSETENLDSDQVDEVEPAKVLDTLSVNGEKSVECINEEQTQDAVIETSTIDQSKLEETSLENTSLTPEEVSVASLQSSSVADGNLFGAMVPTKPETEEPVKVGDTHSVPDEESAGFNNEENTEDEVIETSTIVDDEPEKVNVVLLQSSPVDESVNLDSDQVDEAEPDKSVKAVNTPTVYGEKSAECINEEYTDDEVFETSTIAEGDPEKTSQDYATLSPKEITVDPLQNQPVVEKENLDSNQVEEVELTQPNTEEPVKENKLSVPDEKSLGSNNEDNIEEEVIETSTIVEDVSGVISQESASSSPEKIDEIPLQNSINVVDTHSVPSGESSGFSNEEYAEDTVIETSTIVDGEPKATPQENASSSPEETSVGLLQNPPVTEAENLDSNQVDEIDLTLPGTAKSVNTDNIEDAVIKTSTIVEVEAETTSQENVVQLQNPPVTETENLDSNQVRDVELTQPYSEDPLKKNKLSVGDDENIEDEVKETSTVVEDEPGAEIPLQDEVEVIHPDQSAKVVDTLSVPVESELETSKSDNSVCDADDEEFDKFEIHPDRRHSQGRRARSQGPNFVHEERSKISRKTLGNLVESEELDIEQHKKELEEAKSKPTIPTINVDAPLDEEAHAIHKKPAARKRRLYSHADIADMTPKTHQPEDRPLLRVTVDEYLKLSDTDSDASSSKRAKRTGKTRGKKIPEPVKSVLPNLTPQTDDSLDDPSGEGDSEMPAPEKSVPINEGRSRRKPQTESTDSDANNIQESKTSGRGRKKQEKTVDEITAVSSEKHNSPETVELPHRENPEAKLESVGSKTGRGRKKQTEEKIQTKTVDTTEITELPQPENPEAKLESVGSKSSRGRKKQTEEEKHTETVAETELPELQQPENPDARVEDPQPEPVVEDTFATRNNLRHKPDTEDETQVVMEKASEDKRVRFNSVDSVMVIENVLHKKDADDTSTGRSRRKAPVSYKEEKLNTKKRRGTNDDSSSSEDVTAAIKAVEQVIASEEPASEKTTAVEENQKKSQAPKRRGRKAVEVSTKEESSEVEESQATSKTVEESNGENNVDESSATEKTETIEKVEESQPRKRRGRKVVEELKASEKTEPKVEETQTTKRRGKKTIEESSVENTVEDSISAEKTESTDQVEESQTRIEESSVEKVDEESIAAEKTESKVEESLTTKRRGKKTVEKSGVEIEESISAEKTESTDKVNLSQTTKRRGKKTVEESSTKAVEVSIAAEKTESKVEESLTTKRRGKKKVEESSVENAVEDSIAAEETESKVKGKQTSKRRGKKTVKESSDEIAIEESIAAVKTGSKDKIDEEQTTKRRGKKAIEESIMEKAVEESSANNAVEESIGGEETEPKDKVEESQTTKQRGKKAVAKSSAENAVEEPSAAEKTESTDKGEESQTTKNLPTRRRGRKAVEVPSTKVLSVGVSTETVEDVENETTQTKRRGGKAVKKTAKAAEPEVTTNEAGDSKATETFEETTQKSLPPKRRGKKAAEALAIEADADLNEKITNESAVSDGLTRPRRKAMPTSLKEEKLNTKKRRGVSEDEIVEKIVKLSEEENYKTTDQTATNENSGAEGSQSEEESNQTGGRPRRKAQPGSLKEEKLNTKKRRQDAELEMDGKTVTLSLTVHNSQEEEKPKMPTKGRAKKGTFDNLISSTPVRAQKVDNEVLPIPAKRNLRSQSVLSNASVMSSTADITEPPKRRGRKLDASSDVSAVEEPPKKRGRGAAKKNVPAVVEEPVEIVNAEVPSTSRGRRGKIQTVVEEELPIAVANPAPPKAKRGRAKAESKLEESSEAGDIKPADSSVVAQVAASLPAKRTRARK